MKLSKREKDVFDLAVKGLKNKEIARELEISPETVKTHIRSIYKEVGAPRTVWSGLIFEPRKESGFIMVGYMGPNRLRDLKSIGFTTTTLTGHRAFEDDIEIYVKENGDE